MTAHDRPQFTNLSAGHAGIGNVFQERPNKYMLLMAFAQEVLRETSHLSPTQREVIAAFTSRLNGCEYSADRTRHSPHRLVPPTTTVE